MSRHGEKKKDVFETKNPSGRRDKKKKNTCRYTVWDRDRKRRRSCKNVALPNSDYCHLHQPKVDLERHIQQQRELVRLLEAFRFHSSSSSSSSSSLSTPFSSIRTHPASLHSFYDRHRYHSPLPSTPFTDTFSPPSFFALYHPAALSTTPTATTSKRRTTKT